MSTDPEFFSVYPITNCPHIKEQHLTQFEKILKEKGKELLKQKCMKDGCCIEDENWLCLECEVVLCSRYKNQHMLEHVEETLDHVEGGEQNEHPVAFSFSDASYWCFRCNDYITNQTMKTLSSLFGDIKHSKNNTNNNNQSQKKEEDDKSTENINELMDDLSKKVEKLKLFNRIDIVEMIKTKKVKKVCFLTGAGISTSCGIPDFRTPGTGLYSKLQEYNLAFPEQIFHLEYFRHHPEAFYTFCREFLNVKTQGGYTPSIAHHFIAMFYQHQQLLINLTQNIDSLELQTALSPDKLVQAHGNALAVHCPFCQQDKNIDTFKQHLKDNTIMKCEKCELPIKPKIVFFGEGLPMQFFYWANKMDEVDLCFVMGTSLKVAPFCTLVSYVNQKVPIVVINRECDHQLLEMPNLLFLQGEIDQICQELIQDLGWQVPNNKQPDQ